MIDLLSSTNVYRQMPKELFDKYLNTAKPLKKTFADAIESIVWVNKLSPETLSVWPGKILSEIAVVEIVLKRQAVSRELIEMINRETNQYTVFVVRYEEWGQIWCGNSESGNRDQDQLRFDTYYQTNWQPYNELELKVEGWDLDCIYENILMQITGVPIALKNDNDRPEPILKTESNDNREAIRKLEETISKLEKQIKDEKLFDRQLKLMGALKKEKDEMKKIIALHMSQSKNRQPIETAITPEPIENIRFFFPNVFVTMKDQDGNPFDVKTF